MVSTRMMWSALLALTLSLSSLAAMLAAGVAQGSPRLAAPGDLPLYGLVYDVSAGPSRGIAGAAVSVSMCVPRSFHATSGLDGSHELFLPGSYLRQCSEVTLGVSADGYQDYSQVLALAELYAQPQRDIGLRPESAPTPAPTATIGPPASRVFLPVVMVSR